VKNELSELYEILNTARELQERVKKIEVLPNWEQRVKSDMLRHLKQFDLCVSDFIMSS